MTIVRGDRSARVSVGNHVLLVVDKGSPEWPDWWLCDLAYPLRRVRDMEHGITTARVTLACREAPKPVDPWADGARVNWREVRPADLLNGGSSVRFA